MHICISKQNITSSDNGLLPGWCQSIIGTNAGILLIGPLAINFSEILIKIHIFFFKKMHLKMLSGKRWPFVSASMCYKWHSHWTNEYCLQYCNHSKSAVTRKFWENKVDIMAADALDLFIARSSAAMLLTIWDASLSSPAYAISGDGIFQLWGLTHWGRVTHICVGKLTIIWFR